MQPPSISGNKSYFQSTEQPSSQTQTDTATNQNKPRPEQSLTDPISHAPRNDVLKDSCTVS
jgi:hypothetical protein